MDRATFWVVKGRRRGNLDRTNSPRGGGQVDNRDQDETRGGVTKNIGAKSKVGKVMSVLIAALDGHRVGFIIGLGGRQRDGNVLGNDADDNFAKSPISAVAGEKELICSPMVTPRVLAP